MKKTLLLLLAMVVLLVCCVGCGSTNTDDDLPVDTSVDIVPLLSVEEVYNATGIKVTDPQESGEGVVGYFSEDTLSGVYIAAQEGTKEAFETMKENLSVAGELTDAPNLGDAAIWCEQSCVLMVYVNEKIIDVCVEYANPNPNDSLLAARQLAALLIEKM